tara:strand:+ start:747 stop:971 length:225 start_codon:yes stop_codon:yes gene_type:complete
MNNNKPIDISTVCFTFNNNHVVAFYALSTVAMFVMILLCILYRGRYDRFEKELKDVSEDIKVLLKRNPGVFLKT